MIINKLSGIFFIILCYCPLYILANNCTYFIAAQHNYMRLNFNNPEKLDGFTTAVSTGFKYQKKWFRSDLSYEGSFSTKELHGFPCQRSQIQEHLLIKKCGACWQLCEDFKLEGYLGFGFNRFINHQDPAHSCSSTDGFVYKYTNLTIPVAVHTYWDVTNNSTIGLYVEWRPDIWARLHLLDYYLNNKRNHAFRVAVPIKHNLHRNNRISLTFLPFFDWKRFGSACITSCNNTSLVIPFLTRWSIGAQIIADFKF